MGEYLDKQKNIIDEKVKFFFKAYKIYPTTLYISEIIYLRLVEDLHLDTSVEATKKLVSKKYLFGLTLNILNDGYHENKIFVGLDI